MDEAGWKCLLVWMQVYSKDLVLGKCYSVMYKGIVQLSINELCTQDAQTATLKLGQISASQAAWQQVKCGPLFANLLCNW